MLRLSDCKAGGGSEESPGRLEKPGRNPSCGGGLLVGGLRGNHDTQHRNGISIRPAQDVQATAFGLEGPLRSRRGAEPKNGPTCSENPLESRVKKRRKIKHGLILF